MLSRLRGESNSTTQHQKNAPFEDFEVMERPFWRGKRFQVLCWFFVGQLCVKVWFSIFSNDSEYDDAIKTTLDYAII